MAVGREPVVVSLTVAQALRCEKLAEYLWPASRRLLLEHFLWAESKRNLVESVRIFPQGAK